MRRGTRRRASPCASRSPARSTRADRTPPTRTAKRISVTRAPLPGADAITAFADTDSDTAQDPGEPFATATKAWTLPVTTPLCKAKSPRAADHRRQRRQGHLRRQCPVNAAGNVKGQEQYQDHGPAQPLKVKSINVLALTCNPQRTQATIFGRATINGQGSHLFRIDVQDLGEPGVGTDTYRILLGTGYDSGSQTLLGGNIQIH